MAAIVAGTFTIAAAAASQRSFIAPLGLARSPGWLTGPLAGVGPAMDGTSFRWLVTAMCGCYLVAVWCADALPPRATVAAILLADLILFIGPPLLSTDVATYLAYARLGALHGLGPYTHPPHALPAGDALRPWVVREAGASDYGPPFTVLTYPLAFVSVAVAIWTLKLVAVLSSVAIVALVAACARRLGGSSMRAVVLVGLNPLVLLYAIGGDHNDLLMMAALMLGVWLTLRGGRESGIVAATVATGLKVSAAPAALMMLLGPPRRRRAILAALVTAVVLTLVVVVVFGNGEVIVNYLRQIYHGGHAFARRYSVPAMLGQLFGLHGVYGITSGVRAAATALLLAALLALLVRVLRGADWLSSAGWAQLASLVTATWLWPWYIIWVLPFAALARQRWLTLGALLFTIFLLATQVFQPLG